MFSWFRQWNKYDKGIQKCATFLGHLVDWLQLIIHLSRSVRISVLAGKFCYSENVSAYVNCWWYILMDPNAVTWTYFHNNRVLVLHCQLSDNRHGQQDESSLLPGWNSMHLTMLHTPMHNQHGKCFNKRLHR